MKYALIILIFTCLAFANDKPLKVELTAQEWQKHLNGLQYVNQTLDNSPLPANQVKFIRDSILAPLQYDIVTQVRPQIDTTKKK